LYTATGIKGGDIVLSSKISSQFVSSILMAAPYAKTPVKLSLTGKTVSQPFIDMTTRLMEQFGIATTHNAETNQYDIPLGVYKNPEEFVIEADASSASYPLAMAAITGGKVTVSNVGGASLQVRIVYPTFSMSLPFGLEVK
jgi:pentafunctional AROM polypeptide